VIQITAREMAGYISFAGSFAGSLDGSLDGKYIRLFP
jgi:hypothetical protein